MTEKLILQYKERFKFINYSEALNNYDIKKLQTKYQLKLKNYRERIDLINLLSKKSMQNQFLLLIFRQMVIGKKYLL